MGFRPNDAGLKEVSRFATENSASVYVKLSDDGDSVTGVFLGDPLGFSDEYQGQAQPRVAWNFYDCETATVRALRINLTTFNAVKKYLAKNGYDTACTITRVGEKGSKRTVYMLVKHHTLSGEEITVLDALELHDLGKLFAIRDQGRDQPREQPAPAPKPAAPSEPVISQTEADSLVKRLKDLPPEAGREWAAAWGRAATLPVSKLRDASVALEALEARHADDMPF